MATKNDPKNKVARKKVIGDCGHEIVPVMVKGIKGSARMRKYCEKCGVV